MGGISMAQLRWVFSDWTESELEADGLDLSSTTPNNDGDNLREWGDLDASCDDTEITLWAMRCAYPSPNQSKIVHYFSDG